MSGPMCGMDEVIEWAEGILHPSDTDVLPERILRRLHYMKLQSEGVEPKHFKGIQGPTYDYNTCGKCGHTVQVYNRYCPSCGFYLKWPSTPCLLPYSEERPWDEGDYEIFFRQQVDETLKDGTYSDEDVRMAEACRDAFHYKRIKKQDEKLAKEQRDSRTKRLINKIERDNETQTKRVYYSDEVVKIVRKCKEF